MQVQVLSGKYKYKYKYFYVVQVQVLFTWKVQKVQVLCTCVLALIASESSFFFSSIESRFGLDCFLLVVIAKHSSLWIRNKCFRMPVVVPLVRLRTASHKLHLALLFCCLDMYFHRLETLPSSFPVPVWASIIVEFEFSCWFSFDSSSISIMITVYFWLNNSTLVRVRKSLRRT